MKKIVIFTLLTLLSLNSFAQKWALTASATAGGNITQDATIHGRYNDDFFDKDQIYDNSQLYYSFDLGIKTYFVKWAYFKAGAGYFEHSNKYNTDMLPIGFNNPNRTLKTNGISVPLIFGFAYHNKSKFYPAAEIGASGCFAIDNTFGDNKFMLGSIGRLGGGYKINDKIALEIMFSSNSLYSVSKSNNTDLKRKTNNQQLGLGLMFGLSINM